MKIGIVCLNLSWQAGGVRLIYSLVHALQNLGHKVIVYAPEINESAYPDLRKGIDIRIIALPQAIEWQYASRSLLVRVFEKIKREKRLMAAARAISERMDGDFDILNVHDFSYRVAEIYKKKNLRAKIIWTMNDPPYMYLPKTNIVYDFLSRIFNWYKDFAERRYFRFIDGVVVLLNRNRVWAETRGMKAKVIWSGLEFDRFSAPPKRIEGKSSFVILGVGALNQYRRFEDIISAVKILRARSRDVRAVIVCKNIWKEDAYAAQLLEFAQKEGVASYVDFRFDGVSDNDLRALYAASDFFALTIHLPPPRNGFGWQMVHLEAMAAGTPVILSRKIDAVEALRNGKTALFVDPLSPDQIADAVEHLIKNPELYARISKDAREFVKSMTWERYAKEMVAFDSIV